MNHGQFFTHGRTVLSPSQILPASAVEFRRYITHRLMRRGLWLTLVALTASLAHAQEPSDKTAAAPGLDCLIGIPNSGARGVEGSLTCGLCHGRGNASQDGALPFDAAYMSKKIRLDEQIIWRTRDKHRQAFEVLLNDRSQQIARIMGIVDQQTGNSLAHRDVRCIACHTSVPLSSITHENNLLAEEVIENPTYNFGVSCEGCHGPSGNGAEMQNGWAAAHWQKSTKWEFLTVEEKFENYGFWDVRTPRSQAKICLTCHVGDVGQGKIMTHEMYAAGHPPLPSFELNTFIRQQPQHWRFTEEKDPEIREKILVQRGETYDPQELYRTRSLLVSSLMTASAAMQLNADLIDADVTSPTEKPTWPELGNFSCFACHHDLKREGWRQQRPLTSTPGRPTLHEWPMAMVAVAAEYLGHAEDFQTELKNIYDVMNQQPFGRSDELLAASRTLANLTDRWAAEIQRQHVKLGSDGDKLLRLIGEKGTKEAYDYDSARQLVWAYERVLDDVLRRKAQLQKDQLTDADQRPEWTGWFPEDGPLTEEAATLNALEDLLLLDLRTGEEVRQVIGQESTPRSRVEVELAISFRKISSYDPTPVRAAFQKLLTLRPAK